MTSPQVVAVIYGFLTGLAFIPVYEGAHLRVISFWSPIGSTLRTLVVMLLATLTACVASAVLMLLPGYLIDVLPFRENTPYFGFPFLMGALITRMIIERRKHHRRRGFE